MVRTAAGWWLSLCALAVSANEPNWPHTPIRHVETGGTIQEIRGPVKLTTAQCVAQVAEWAQKPETVRAWCGSTHYARGFNCTPPKAWDSVQRKCD